MSNDGNPPVPPSPYSGDPNQSGQPYPTGGQPYPTGGQPYPTGGQPYPSTPPTPSFPDPHQQWSQGQPQQWNQGQPVPGQPDPQQQWGQGVPPVPGHPDPQQWSQGGSVPGQPDPQQQWNQGQPVPGQPEQYQPWAQPGQQPPAAAKKKPVVLIAVGVVVLLVAGLVAFLFTRGGDETPVASDGADTTVAADVVVTPRSSAADSTTDEADATTSAAPSSAASTELTATEYVEAYLTAIADGDAAEALTYLDTNVDRTLLTDEVLAASAAVAPMTDIVVGDLADEDIAYGGDLDVSFKLGDRAVDTTITAIGRDGDYELISALGYVSVPDGVGGLSPAINGVAVEPGMHDAFFGSYELTVDRQYFTLTGQTVETVLDRSSGPGFYDADVALDDEGKAVFHSVVKTAVDACVASKNYVAGCGIDVPAQLSNGSVNEGTINRTLAGDVSLKLQDLKPEPSSQNPFFVRGDYIGRVDVTAECVQDGQTGTCSVLGSGTSLGAPTVDFSVDPMTIVWN